MTTNPSRCTNLPPTTKRSAYFTFIQSDWHKLRPERYFTFLWDVCMSPRKATSSRPWRKTDCSPDCWHSLPSLLIFTWLLAFITIFADIHLNWCNPLQCNLSWSRRRTHCFPSSTCVITWHRRNVVWTAHPDCVVVSYSYVMAEFAGQYCHSLFTPAHGSWPCFFEPLPLWFSFTPTRTVLRPSLTCDHKHILLLLKNLLVWNRRVGLSVILLFGRHLFSLHCRFLATTLLFTKNDIALPSWRSLSVVYADPTNFCA